MKFPPCPHLFLDCMLACCVCSSGGRRIFSSSYKNGTAGKNAHATRHAVASLAAVNHHGAHATRHAVASLAPETSKPFELKAEKKLGQVERKLEQELASVHDALKHGLSLYGPEADFYFQQDVSSVRDAIRQGLNPYGTKAWRAAHAVNIGVECQGAGVQTAEGGSTILSVHTHSPKACGAFCKQTEGCAAWSWNNEEAEKNCHAQQSCERRVSKSNMVSGMKASFNGLWYYKISDDTDFDFDEDNWFEIIVDRAGEMSFESSDGEHGLLKIVHGSAHDAHLDSTTRDMSDDEGFWNEELKAKLEGTEWEDAGSVGLRLADGRIQLRSWLDDEDNVTQFIAEKKEVQLQLYDRVTVKEDQEINDTNVQLRVPVGEEEQSVILKKGDIGSVHNIRHPFKTGVVFDQDPRMIVWVRDALLLKSAILNEVSEHQVRVVMGDLGDILGHAIQDPITLEVFRDPVMASDGFTYERSAMEHLLANVDVDDVDETARSPITREPLSSLNLSSNYAIRSLVSSVIEKVEASRVAAVKIQKRFRGYRQRKLIIGRGNVPDGWWSTS